MCASRKNFRSASEILDFTLPKLHTGKSWYVDFTAWDPVTETMRRKKYMLDHLKKKSERKQRAAEMIESITRQLRHGWSPWVDAEENRGYVLLSDALAKYEASIERLHKYKTRKSYSSKLKILRDYISVYPFPIKFVYQFDAAFVTSFLDWVYMDRENTERTRNNYRGWCGAVATFFMERQYISSNPIEKIRELSEAPKKRQPLSHDMLREMCAYLAPRDRKFLLACRMQYYTLIRPSELAELRVGDISVAEQSVFVSAQISKNKRNGKVGLNETIIMDMLDLGVLNHDSDCYIFGKDMKTCAARASSEQFRRKWKKLRKALKWEDKYQFYSLKDSGIRDLSNSAGIIVARDQARHTDVATTNRYLQGANLPVHEEAKKFEGYL